MEEKGTESVIEKWAKVPHPKTREIGVMIMCIIMSFIGAIVGTELITRLGITPNTSIIGALGAVLVGLGVKSFRNIHRQNLVQTAISTATFGAGNVMLLTAGIIWLMGRQDLVLPMFIGAGFAMLVDITMIYWLFDTPAFPADAAWPPGIATSETILAAAEGGKRALLLIAGGIVGAVGQAFGIPMDIAGICLIGNIWALLMFGVGLLIRAYSPVLFKVDINKLYIPHGMMIGAGVVSLIQIALIIRGKRLVKKEEELVKKTVRTKSAQDISKALRNGFILYIIGATVLALISGIFTGMSVLMLIWWIIWATIAALVSELMVGISAMHAGWFPGFATALIFLVLGMLMKFPPIALVFLVGYTAATGPAFADLGYDLKAGWLLRGQAKDVEFELSGRRQQYIAEVLGGIVAIVFVALVFKLYFTQNLFPPVDKVFVATIKAGATPGLWKTLLLWAIVGAVVQWVGGAERQIGILFSTGLLILNPKAGWAAIVTLAVRAVLEKIYGEKVETPMYITGAGFIAGSTLYSFFASTAKVFFVRKK
jgi:uncharacterized oligopeptide transporter (OPT) family protein